MPRNLALYLVLGQWCPLRQFLHRLHPDQLPVQVAVLLDYLVRMSSLERGDVQRQVVVNKLAEVGVAGDRGLPGVGDREDVLGLERPERQETASELPFSTVGSKKRRSRPR